MSRTVSSRIPKELHEKLRDHCNDLGVTVNDYVKEAIEQSFDDNNARKRLSEFTFPCSECNKQIIPTRESLLKAFKDWGHAECINKRSHCTRMIH
jgi:hypothetical protein